MPESFPGAETFLARSPRPSLTLLKKAARTCRGCDLYQRATQTVFGAGPLGARLMLVGEQPGDQEDRAGKPFVGPAGALLDRALAEAGIERAETYVTNAVKHFKWTPALRGKKRLHAKPSSRQIKACQAWLVEEVRLVNPQVLVLMGATAAQSVLGADFRVSTQRGQVIQGHAWGHAIVATVHPSAILRAPDEIERRRQFELLVDDLRAAAFAAEHVAAHA